ncbi:hypothetical protein Plo01_20200 [Planobispora longispora]|uniref:Uncharacterized protein n=1 Tax=Planobispora longispora TaxID=28887 RepID=A0A8J3RK16_9ACTN|nr:hypothetical protein GCM10020093_071890 [Planobispora longispora]GIH75591.1 hypothetical protein Plo01_20200 [Planobispora longispora]
MGAHRAVPNGPDGPWARKNPRRNLEVGVGCGRKDDAVGHDELDLRVHDRDALDEIALYAEVLSAVAISERPLTLAELDNALGLSAPATC